MYISINSTDLSVCEKTHLHTSSSQFSYLSRPSILAQYSSQIHLEIVKWQLTN